jgi:hypothetical protein
MTKDTMSMCTNWPCQRPRNHPGPCSSSTPEAPTSNPMASPGELIVALRSGLGRANMGEQAFDWIIVYLMRYTELMRRLGLPSDAELPVETTAAPVAWRYKDARGHWRYTGSEPKPEHEILQSEPLYTR